MKDNKNLTCIYVQILQPKSVLVIISKANKVMVVVVGITKVVLNYNNYI